MASELKPCPFCGCDLVERGIHPTHFKHPPNSCVCAGTVLYDPEDAAAWNCRAERPPAPMGEEERDKSLNAAGFSAYADAPSPTLSDGPATDREAGE